VGPVAHLGTLCYARPVMDDHADHAGAPDGPSSGGHAHSHVSLSAGQRHKGRLLAAFGVLFVFMLVEVVGAWATSSLALLSDAGHMLTDVVGIGMALAAIHLAGRGSARSYRTFGWYRLEILAALANSVLLFGVAAYVLVEAIRRFTDPADVLAGPMLVIAILGLGANLVAFWLLRAGAKESLNVEGAYLEVLADTVGSVGVIVGAIVLAVTGWEWVDPVVGVAIGLWIVPRTIRLAGQALRILVQAAPAGTDIDALRADLAAVDGVVDVHDLHVWTLTSDMDVASAHLMVGASIDHHRVLDRARDLLRDRYGIGHATLQVEPEDHTGCDEVGW
jgi:cobalt-zinc-cadmium efflux system protein